MCKQAFREFLVSPALISNLNVHKSVGFSHVKCQILPYSLEIHLMRVGSSVKRQFHSLDTPITCTHNIVRRRESIPCGATTCIYMYATCTASPHAVNQILDHGLGQWVPLFLEESPVRVCGLAGYWPLWPNHICPR